MTDVPDAVRRLLYTDRHGVPAPVEGRCAASVYRKVGRWRQSGRCEKAGTRTEHGYLWCGTHAPSAAQRREKASQQRFEDEMRRRGQAGDLRVAERRLVDALVAGEDHAAALADVLRLRAGRP